MNLCRNLQQVAAQAGITMVEPSTSVPRMRLDRVQAGFRPRSPESTCIESRVCHLVQSQAATQSHSSGLRCLESQRIES